MRNAIPPMKAFGASWAADNIESPFLYLPNSIAVGTALGTTGVPIVSNIAGAPATFAVVDANSSADDNEGYFTQDHATNADYIWSGNAAYDVPGHPLYDMGVLLPTGTENGIGGKTLLIAFTLFAVAGATTPGGLMGFGRRAAASPFDGWGLGFVPGTSVLNFGVQINGGIVQADCANASLTARDVPVRVAILMDAKNGEILTAVGGQAVTVAGKATILAALDAQSTARLRGGWHFGSFNASVMDDSSHANGANTAQCRWRDMLIMDMSGYANAQADFYELADRLYRAPAYSLPHWMDRF